MAVWGPLRGAQWVKEFAMEPNDLSSSPRTYIKTGYTEELGWVLKVVVVGSPSRFNDLTSQY